VPGWVTVFGRVNYLGDVTSYPGQLSLAISLLVGAMNTSLGWEGYRRSGVALPCVTDSSVYLPTGSTAYEREMSSPPTLLLEYGPPSSFAFTNNGNNEC